MKLSKLVLGFDRKISLSWLDATMQLVASGLSTKEIREELDTILSGQVAGTSPHSARGKTKTVLMHIWVSVPAHVVSLRDRAIQISHLADENERLALHWGMCIATYPLFLDIALTTGRLLQMQEEVSLAQVQRRVTESWGDRSTLSRAIQRGLRNFVDWNVLFDAQAKGHYTSAPPIDLGRGQRSLRLWLSEAYMLGSDVQIKSLRDLSASPALFPFLLNLSSADFESSSGLEYATHGLGEEIVIMR